MNPANVPLRIITGPSGSGKTTHCAAIAAAARQAGKLISGLLSPAVFDGDQKIAIDLVSVASGDRRRLAQRDALPSPAVRVGWWHMDPAVLRWANAQLRAVAPQDTLILDELGPLEFEQGEGFYEGLRLLDAGAYNEAIVVIRPRLLKAALSRWPHATVLDLARERA